MKRILISLLLLSIGGQATATCAYVGSASFSTSSSVANVQVTYSPAAGNALVVMTTITGNVVTGTTVTDTGRNSWTNAFQVFNSNGGDSEGIWVEANATAGLTTFTFTPPTSTAFIGIAVVEYSGVSTTTPFVSGQYAQQIQFSPGTGTNAITTTNTPTLSASPCMLVGASTDNNGSNKYPGAGSAFTDRGHFWNYGNGTSFDSFRLEDETISGTSAVAALFTAQGTLGTDPYYSQAVVLQAGGGATCTHSGWNIATGAFSTPTAGSGTFWLKTGAKGSTDCSATQYWQSTGGGQFAAN